MSSLIYKVTSLFPIIDLIIKSNIFSFIYSLSIDVIVSSRFLISYDYLFEVWCNLATYRFPFVRVPVLEMHNSSRTAHFWIASRFFIKILSFFSLVTERARAIDTARGIPSGIATINKQTHVIAILLAIIKLSDEKRLLSEIKIV